MNTQFPRTLAAVKKGENSLWNIGDALIEECGPPSKLGIQNGDYQKLEKVSAYLAENGGYAYSTNRLSALRTVAYNFQNSERKFEYSWSVHQAAGNPATLNAIVAAAPKGTRISEPYIEKILEAKHQEALAAHNAEAEKRKEVLEKAQKAEAAARKKEREAQDEAERARAAKAATKAAERAAEAAKEAKKVRRAPKKRDVVITEQDEHDKLLTSLGLHSGASEAIVLAEKTKERLLDNLDKITETARLSLIERYVEAANAWRSVAVLLQDKKIGTNSHLAVVGE
jgi:flagellar biosynthesis GTPase FlhF